MTEYQVRRFEVGDPAPPTVALIIEGSNATRWDVAICEAGEVIWAGDRAKLVALVRDAAKSSIR